MNVKELLKEKKLIASEHLIKQAIDKKLSIEEFLFLLYFENANQMVFDLELIKQNTHMDEEKIMSAFNQLMSKNLISSQPEKDLEGRIVDTVSLNQFYDVIEKEIKEEKKNVLENTIYETFENEFARTLSPSEYEYINRFLEIGFSEELILGALKEAVYNGATNMRYIDTVLHEWKRKGYQTMDDVKKNVIKKEEEKNPEIYEFDWLNDNEE